MKVKAKGFSLIELMITVAIIGVIAAIAIPGYQGYILRSKQAGAKAVLLDIAQKQPQFLADRRSTYAESMIELGLSAEAQITALYEFSITLSLLPPGYVAVAKPIDAQVGTTSFHIDNAGVRLKGINGVAGTETW